MQRRLSLALPLVLAAAAVTAQASLLHRIPIAVEYDHTSHLAAHTYSWGVAQMVVPGLTPVVRAAVDKTLAKRGWQMVPSGGAATVFVEGDVQGMNGSQAFYNGLNAGWDQNWSPDGWGAGWKPYYGELTTNALERPGNNLVIDIFDSASHRLLLRAVAGEQLWDKQKKTTKYLNESVKKMLKTLPG